MSKLIYTLLLLLTFINNSFAQDLYYLNESWENPASISQWTQNPIIANKEWLYTSGGQWWQTPTDGPYNPELSWPGGGLNAGLYFSSTLLDSVKLISPALELAGAEKPTLRFYHCQYDKIFSGVDNLRLLFRAGPDSPWDIMHIWTTNIDYWKDEIFEIAEKYHTDTFQLAFEGVIGNGYGVYVDSVTVKEDTIVNKYVKKTTYNSIDYQAIPAGGTDIPLEQITIRILGNQGDAILDSLTIVPTGAGISYLEENSFKLFYTLDDFYGPYKSDTSAQIASASLVGGTVVFSNINQNLKIGDNHLWISASFKNTLQGQTTVRFQIPTNGINIGDTLYPGSTLDLEKAHLIKETVFYDDFESGGTGWILDGTGDFEIGWPDGNKVGTQNNPTTPFNGNKILATNLDGSYKTGIDSSSRYYAYTPELNLKYYINSGLYMQNHSTINGSDKGVIDFSIDGGTTWQNFWQSDASSNNSYWTEFYNTSISKFSKHQSQFQLRFGIIKTESTPWPGFSIDNFAVIAEKLYTDVGVSQILSPYNDCLDCGNDIVKVWFKNHADGTAPTIIPVYYGLWGVDTILVRDTIYGGIAKDDSILFTFSQQANFPNGDYYDKFVVGLDLSGDQDVTNDTLTKSLIIQNNYSPQHFEDFEYKGGIWLQNESSSWNCLNANENIPPFDSLTPNIWVLSIGGDYRHNDTSWVTSGCYNLSDISRNVVQFMFWSQSEYEKDGARLEYSIDDGMNWGILNDSLYGDGWGWLPDTVEALKSRGWTGNHDWTTVKAIMPTDLDTVHKAKFRVKFMSDGSGSSPQGFAFDNFEIFPAPHDIGISSVLSPIDACQGVNATTVSVRVKNYGYNALHANDTILVGVDFNNDLPYIDTLILSAELLPGNTVDFVVNTNIDITTPIGVTDSTYNISAYTLYEDDPWYYLANNDTAHYSFTVWKNPIIILADTIGSRQPDTLSIIPVYPDYMPGYTFLWQPDGSITDSIYDVSDNGFGDTIYSVFVTEPLHGCSTLDSVNILLLYSDAGVDSILTPISSCELTGNEIVQVRVRNMGTDSIYSVLGDSVKLVIAYRVVGDASIFADTITVKDPIRAGNTINYEFVNHPYDFSGVKDYTIKAWAFTLGSDLTPSNDSTTKSISVYGYTPIPLGGDKIVEALGYTLDAGPDFISYAWNTGDLTRTTFLDASVNDASGLYYVDVIDANGCGGSDSINVTFKIIDIIADALVAPVTKCERNNSSYIELRIINNGSDTIQVTDSIRYSYIVNGGSIIRETMVPDNPIPPTWQYFHTFNNSVDFSAYGNYQFEITASVIGDLRTSNDSASGSFSTYATPNINLGEYPDPIFDFAFELDAGAGPYDYLWQDNTTAQTYTATATGFYGVAATDTNTGCIGGDTTFLVFDILDYAVTEVIGLGSEVDICQGADRAVTISVANLGNQNRENAEISVGYIINNETPVIENHTVEGTWLPGNSKKRDVVLTEAVVFNTNGNNTFKAFVSHAADIKPENDSLSVIVPVDASPLVDFGGDTLFVSIPHTLDAGNHEYYQWQNNYDGRYFEVTDLFQALYTVTVRDIGNSCITTRSVWIEPSLSIGQFSSKNLELELYPNPADEFITIEANDINGKELYLEIYSITNQLIWSDYHEGFGLYHKKLDISSFNEGVYLLRIRNVEINHVQRFIIK